MSKDIDFNLNPPAHISAYGTGYIREDIKCPKEKWLTLDEFLASEFEGLLWVRMSDGNPDGFDYIDYGYFSDDVFHSDSSGSECYKIQYIKGVMPIYKPEAPE